MHLILGHSFIRQMLMELNGDTNSNTIKTGDFNTSPSSMDRSSKQKLTKKQ